MRAAQGDRFMHLHGCRYAEYHTAQTRKGYSTWLNPAHRMIFVCASRCARNLPSDTHGHLFVRVDDRKKVPLKDGASLSHPSSKKWWEMGTVQENDVYDDIIHDTHHVVRQ